MEAERYIRRSLCERSQAYDRLVAAIRGGELGAGAGAVERVKVSLHESHIAAASFEGHLP